MKKYFLHNGTEQDGPFNIEELKEKKISRETSIWFEGLEEWTTAGKIEELNPIFSSIPTVLKKPFQKHHLFQKLKLNEPK